MNRTNLIRMLCFVLVLQVLFTALRYFGGYEPTPMLTSGVTAGLVSVYFVRQRRRAR